MYKRHCFVRCLHRKDINARSVLFDSSVEKSHTKQCKPVSLAGIPFKQPAPISAYLEPFPSTFYFPSSLSSSLEHERHLNKCSFFFDANRSLISGSNRFSTRLSNRLQWALRRVNMFSDTRWVLLAPKLKFCRWILPIDPIYKSIAGNRHWNTDDDSN